jgi:2-phospho-L-lactate guanylyltransferase
LHTTAIIPVKRLESAHERLSEAVPAQERRRLAEAMFRDLLAKIRRSRYIDDAIIVTSDPAAARHARWLDHTVLERDRDAGHSEDASAGAHLAKSRGAERVVLLPVDCPMLDPGELDAHLGDTPRTALIVPDRHGTGTNALVLCPPDAIQPAFGPDSCARHISRARAAGISFALAQLESLGFDLDTTEDMAELRDALLLDPGPAPRTAQVLWELGSPVPPVAAA